MIGSFLKRFGLVYLGEYKEKNDIVTNYSTYI